MGTNTVKLSRAIAGKTGAPEIPQPTFRMGKVQSVQADGTLTVLIGDDPTPVPGVKSDVNYVPRANDVVNLRVTDDEVYADGMAGVTPSLGVFRGLAGATSVLTRESRGAISFGNLATVGPTTTATVGPSGLLIVAFSCMIDTTSDNDGGAMGIALSGANTLAAAYDRSIIFFPLKNLAIMSCSRVNLYSGLTPGDTVVTCQYRDISDTGTDVFWSNRRMFALPL